MSVITITGLTGSGAPELGAVIAQRAGMDYVDRLILAEAAKGLGATVQAVANMSERSQSIGEKISLLLRTVLERAALATPGSDPYFGPGMDAMLVREYRDITDQSSVTSSQQIEDKQLVEVTKSVMEKLAVQGNLVLIGRGANILLKGWPNTLHVGLVSHIESRITRISARENMTAVEAQAYIVEGDRARISYFKRFLKADPSDSSNYDVSLNTDTFTISQCSDVIQSIIV